MRSFFRFGHAAVVVGGCLLSMAAVADASNIGISFVGGNNNTTDVLPSTLSAGIVPQTNWNNVQNSAHTGSNVFVTGSGGTEALLTYSASSVYDQSSTGGNNSPNTANGDQVLNNGAIYTGGTGTPVTLNVSNLQSVSPSGYTVYAYLLTDHPVNVSVSLTPGGGSATTYYALTPLPNGTGYIDGTTASGFTYTQATSTTSGSPTSGADYAAFSVPASATSFSMTYTLLGGTGSVGSNAALPAIQIVGVTPEPASLALTGLGALGLLARRRRVAAL